MRKKRIIFYFMPLLIFLGNYSYAIMKMDDNGIKDALQYGRTHTLEEIANSPEWTIEERDGTSAHLMTPYNLITLKAAKAKADGQTMTFEEAKAMISQRDGAICLLDILPIGCTVYGPSEEFLNNFTFEIRQGENVFKPMQTEMDQPKFHERSRLYYADYELYFRMFQVDTNSPITLVIVNPIGKEWRYEFDLGNMR